MTGQAAHAASARRVVALDLGARRIGVAVSDPTGTLASPYTVVERSADRAADHLRLAAIVEEVGAGHVVVGMPLSLSGAAGPAAEAAASEIAALSGVVGVGVEAVDERFSTVAAHRSLSAQGMDGRRRRRVVDQAAAAVVLQAWLDRRARAGAGRGAGE